MTRRIGILETGRPRAELQARFSSYAEMSAVVLQDSKADLIPVTYAVLDGEMPRSIDDCEGWLITGSPHGVYENLDWMIALKSFLQACLKAKKPVVGICFGHQILAAAAGARVEKSPKGWGVGCHDYKAEPELIAALGGGDDSLTLLAVHQDQVITCPEGARVLAGSDFCENAILAYGDHALSIQPHPEFTPDYEAALLQMDLADDLSLPEREQALAGLQERAKDLDSAKIGQLIRNFFRA